MKHWLVNDREDTWHTDVYVVCAETEQIARTIAREYGATDSTEIELIDGSRSLYHFIGLDAEHSPASEDTK